MRPVKALLRNNAAHSAGVSFTKENVLKFEVIGFLLVFLSVSTYAQETPRDIVEKYCQYDFQGARLNSVEAQSYRLLVAYEEEPGWDTVIGVKGFEIGRVIVKDNVAVVEVNFEIDRAWPVQIEQISEYSTVKVELSLENGSWKISKYIPFPRVSSEALCKKWGFCAK